MRLGGRAARVLLAKRGAESAVNIVPAWIVTISLPNQIVGSDHFLVELCLADAVARRVALHRPRRGRRKGASQHLVNDSHSGSVHRSLMAAHLRT